MPASERSLSAASSRFRWASAAAILAPDQVVGVQLAAEVRRARHPQRVVIVGLVGIIRGQPRLVGLLNDDTTSVGAVHAGLVYVLDLPVDLATARAAVQVREISKMRGGFGPLVELARLWQTPSQFESWSAFLLRAGVAGPMGDSAERTT